MNQLVVSVNEHLFLQSDTLKGSTILKILAAVAGSSHWTPEKGGTSLILKHEGLLAALWELMTVVIPEPDALTIMNLREFRKEVLLILRNLIR